MICVEFNPCEGGQHFQVDLAVVAKSDSSNISQGQVARLTEAAIRDTRNITPRRNGGVIGDNVVAMRSLKGEKKVRSNFYCVSLSFDKCEHSGSIRTRQEGPRDGRNSC